MRQFIGIMSVLAFVGCANHSGPGGQSEAVNPDFLTVEKDHPLKSIHGLRFDYGHVKNQLDLLILNGAKFCFPAATREAQLREYRILRELDGGLYYDAENDIVIQRLHLSRLERQLEYVLTQEECSGFNHRLENGADGGQSSVETPSFERVLGWLNSDNQFAFNDSRINPKYAMNLSFASHYLRKVKTLQLKVTGHADVIGSDLRNGDLALSRAENVKRYLVGLGIDQTRIEVASASHSAPMYPGQDAHIRLVNRRVVIDLIDVAEAR